MEACAVIMGRASRHRRIRKAPRSKPTACVPRSPSRGPAPRADKVPWVAGLLRSLIDPPPVLFRFTTHQYPEDACRVKAAARVRGTANPFCQGHGVAWSDRNALQVRGKLGTGTVELAMRCRVPRSSGGAPYCVLKIGGVRPMPSMRAIPIHPDGVGDDVSL